MIYLSGKIFCTMGFFLEMYGSDPFTDQYTDS